MTPNNPMNQEVARMGEKQMEWKRYQRQGVIEARSWTYADQHQRRIDVTTTGAYSRISVSAADQFVSGEEPARGWVARNPNNHADQWYIAPDYFSKNYKVSE